MLRFARKVSWHSLRYDIIFCSLHMLDLGYGYARPGSAASPVNKVSPDSSGAFHICVVGFEAELEEGFSC